MTDTTARLNLPAPILTDQFVEDTNAVIRAAGEAQARHAVVKALGLHGHDYQGIQLRDAELAAEDEEYATSEAMEERMAGWTQAEKNAQYDHASMAAVTVLAGMVARLLADAEKNQQSAR